MAVSPQTSAFVAIGLSVIAIGVSIASLAGGSAARGPASEADGTRLADLEQRVARLADRSPPIEAPRRRGAASAATPPAGDAALADRLAALEAEVEELADTVEEATPRIDALEKAVESGGVPRNRPATPEQIAAFRKVVLDTKAAPRPRLLAFRELARAPGGRTIETARAMRKLFEESKDERTRTSAVALMEGFVDAELETWLVDTLLHDRYSSTRESATDVLSFYTRSTRVREALADAAANDKNHDVRADAQNALDKLDEREQD